MTARRLAACVANWPTCAAGDYNPACCRRFPKSCSCDIYDAERVTDDQLEPAPVAPMSRKSHLTTAQFAALNDACIPVVEAFDSMPYLVGSATERPDFRDVDLRLILTDEDFDHWFRGRVMLWSLVCLAITEHLARVTGLPIDFQIQRRTEANENHPDTYRNPMGHRSRPMAGGGDATNFGGAA